MKILHQYCQTSKKLKFAYRWNRLKRIYPVSVLSHLFLVFTFSYILWKIKNLDNQQLEEILTRSLLHDIPEAFTGDIITPTKKAAEWFSKALEEIESKLIQDNFKHLEKFNFYKQLKNYMLFPFKWEIWKIAKFSDNLSALFEAKIENSNYFQTVYKQLKKNLREKNDSALDYILKYWIDYFDDDVEKAWKKFIWIN
jgi:putative hydrolase of HD superfamily